MEKNSINPELLWRLGIIMEKWRKEYSFDSHSDATGSLGVLFRRWLEKDPEREKILRNLSPTLMDQLTDQTQGLSDLIPFGMKLRVPMQQNPADVD